MQDTKKEHKEEAVANAAEEVKAAEIPDAMSLEEICAQGEVAMEQLSLAEKVKELEAKLKEAQDDFLRAKAEVENARRRAQEEVSKTFKFAIEGFAEAMVPVRDSLEMALAVEVPSAQSLKEGVEITLRQLTSAFEKNKLTTICPEVGEKLDPTKHQAVSMVEAKQEANTVVSVLQKGYMIADRLLRPALVTVAKSK